MKFKKFLKEEYHILSRTTIKNFAVFVGSKCFKARMSLDKMKMLGSHAYEISLDAGFMDSMYITLERKVVDSKIVKPFTITRIEFHEVAKVGVNHPYMTYLKHYFGDVTRNYDVKTTEIEPPTQDNTLHMLKHVITLKDDELEGVNIEQYIERYKKD